MLYALVGWELKLINPVPNLLLPYFFGGYKVCRVHSALVRGGLSIANLIEPARTTSSQKWAENFYMSSVWLHFIDLSWTTFILIPVRDGSNGPHQFKVVWLDRTSSDCISTGNWRSEGAICTSWLIIEPHRPCTEPSPTLSLRGVQTVLGALCTSSGRFKHSEPHRTFSNYIITKIGRNKVFFYMSSGWLDCTEPSSTYSLQNIEMVQWGSSTLNFIEPSWTTYLQR